MSRKTSGWACLFATVLFVMQTCLVPVLVAENPRGGEAISVGRDSGEPVSGHAPARQNNSVWGWVAGAAIIVVGGIVGYLLGEDTKKDKDDAKDAAKEAEAAADAAAGSAADAAAAGGESEFKHTIYITGEFAAHTTATYNGGAPFTPSITFAVQTSTYPGGIVDYVSSTTGASTGLGGEYKQVGEHSLMFMVNDGYYLGTASDSGNTIVLENGMVLYPVGSARIIREHN